MTVPSPYSVVLPTRIVFGAGCLNKLGAEAKGLGTRAFLLADPFLAGSAPEALVVNQLEQAGMVVRIWHDIVPNPRAETCDLAAADARQFGADIIIALGGGSTMDAAKAVSLVATNGGNSWDFTARANAEIRIPELRGLPLIAIPTNAGTGAEVTPFAVLSNPGLKLKATIIHAFCHPDIALIDPALHVTKPRRLTASTGMDTFLHAFEGYIGTRPNTWTDLFSIRAMQLVAENLPKACKDPENLAARTQMAEACYMAGITLANIGVGLPHALGQALGALKDTPHGESCAAFLVPVIRWTLPHAQDRLAATACLFQPGLSGKPEHLQAESLADVMTKFIADLGLSVSLGDLGLARGDIADIVRIAQINYGFDIACSQRSAGTDDLMDIVTASF